MTRIFGAETEYAVSRIGGDSRCSRAGVLKRMMAVVSAEHPNLRAADGRGFFLSSGHRIYVDLTDHLEVPTPESSCPLALARALGESDELVSTLAARAAAEVGSEVFVTKTNIDHASTNTWGGHESYAIARGVEFEPHLIPFLASRPVIAGAGGFNNLASTLEFTLSPRCHHLERVTSSESTFARGLIHEARSRRRAVDFERGHHRIHLTAAGESLSSEASIILKHGATALVIGLIETGVRAGAGFELKNPLAAMKTFAGDPTCSVKAPCTDGRVVGALEIQRHYWRLARKHLDRLPDWAGAVLDLWGEVLEGLAAGSEQMRPRLEWVIRRLVFGSYLRARGLDWSRVGSCSPKERAELFELDLKAGRVGPHGLFGNLADALRHRVDRAAFPGHPVPTRAVVRGAAIRECFFSPARKRFVADWTWIGDSKEDLLDLSDPLEREPVWVKASEKKILLHKD